MGTRQGYRYSRGGNDSRKIQEFRTSILGPAAGDWRPRSPVPSHKSTSACALPAQIVVRPRSEAAIAQSAAGPGRPFRIGRHRCLSSLLRAPGSAPAGVPWQGGVEGHRVVEAVRGRARSSGGRFPTARFTACTEHPGQVSSLAAHLRCRRQLHGQDGREGASPAVRSSASREGGAPKPTTP